MDYSFGKQLIYPSRDEKGVYTFVIDQLIDHKYLIKTAVEYHPVVAEYIKQAKPIKGYTQALITALGAGEKWGCNQNGDFFPEEALKNATDEYGYKTFEKFAKVRKHHLNKDHHPSYGDVALSIWNDKMKRVELILKIDEKAAPDLAEALSRGETVDWSMGAKLPFDECSICGHRSKSISEYCEHLKFMMGNIWPETGRQVYAINRYPKFFDISHVLVGADRTNATWLKVANLAHLAPHRKEKSGVLYLNMYKNAAVNKKAEIEKRTPAHPVPAISENLQNVAKNIANKLDERSADIPLELLDALSKFNLSDVVKTLLAAGIVLKPIEFQTIALKKMKRGELADDLYRRKISFDPAECNDEVTEIKPGEIVSDIARTVSSVIPERSFARPVLLRRIIMIKKAEPARGPKYNLVKKANISSNAALVAIPVLAAIGALYVNMLKSNYESKIPTNVLSIIGAGLASGAVDALSTDERPIGTFDLAKRKYGLYNNIGRLDLAQRMHERPVSIVKLSSWPYNQDTLGGLPGLIMSATISNYLSEGEIDPLALKKVASQSDGLLGAPPGIINKAKQTLASFSGKIGSVASLEDIDLFPEDEKSIIADLVILDKSRDL